MERLAGGGEPRSRLLRQGQPTGLVVDGASLEAQFEAAPGDLLLLTAGIPYEEALHIYLLAPDGRLRDALELGAAYAPAILADVRAEGASALTFSFYTGDRWHLAVRPAPRLALRGGLFSPVKAKRGPLSPAWLDLRRLR